MGRRRSAGEGDHVGPLLTETADPPGHILLLRYGLVNGDVIHDGTQLLELDGQHLACTRGTWQQHLEMLDVECLECFQQRLGDKFLGDQIDCKAVLGDLLRGAVADRGNACAAEVAGILMGGVEGLEESFHAIGTGEDDPVIGTHVGQRLDEGNLVGGRLDPDRGKLVGIGPHVAQEREETACLLSGAGDRNSLAEERARLKPVEGFPLVHNLSEDGDGGRLKLLLHCQRGDRGEGSDQRLMTPRGGPTDQRRRGGAFHSVGEKFTRDDRETLDPHKHDLGAGSLGDCGEVDADGLLSLHHMSGEDGEHRVVLAVRDRNTGIGEPADDGADTGNDLETKARCRKLRGFLASSSEDAGVAPLEADDPLSLAGEAEKQGIGLILLHRVTPRRLARVDALRRGWRVAKKFRIGQVVVNHHVGPLQALEAPEREQSGITRSRTNEIADSLSGVGSLGRLGFWGLRGFFRFGRGFSGHAERS